MIDVLPVEDKQTFKEFLNLPFTLYANTAHWVPPLIKDIKDQFSPENPFFKHAKVKPFIAKIDDKTVGRITAIYNEAYINHYGEKTGFFGFFDCVDELTVARVLIERVKKWLRDRGIQRLRGPMNFSSNEEWGLLIEGFDNPSMVMMPYNFPYYQSLYEHVGLVKAKDLFAYIADVPDLFPDKVYRVARIAEKQGITVRPVNMKSFSREMLIFKNIYNSAWERNWGFIPMTDEEIEHMAMKLKSIIVPDLALIAECGGEPAGFMMFLPDVNYVLKRLNGRLLPFGICKALWHSRNIRDARLLLLGIKKGFRRRGVDSLLFIEGLKGLKKGGYQRMEFSWVLEDNYPIQRIIDIIQGRLYKKYRVFECEI